MKYRKMITEMWYLDAESLLDNTSKYIQIPPETILKMCHRLKLRVIRIRLVEKSKISTQEEIFTILSPGFFFCREKFVGKWTQ